MKDDVEVAEPAARGRAASRGPASALLWSFGNTIVSRFGTVAIGIFLARLLGPEAFGTYAIAYLALVAVLSFNELGVSLAIVRWPGDPKAIAPTVTTISVATSLVVFGAVYVLAPPFASAMGDPGAAGLVRLMGLCVIVNGLVATPAALLQRHFRQDQRTVADQVNVWVGALVSVVLAVLGMGATSLAVGRLAGALTSGVLFVLFSPEPYRFGYDRTVVRPLLTFGLPLAGSSAVVFAASYVDQVIVGSVLGHVALGLYVLAFNLSNWPMSMFSQPLRSVAPALFSRLQHDPAEMRTAFGRTLRPLAAITLPTCVVLGVAAEDVIRFVYGDAWAPAADALRWLALLAALRVFVELAYDYLVVLGRTGALFTVQCVWLAAMIPAVLAGAHLAGIGGAAFGQVTVVVLLVVPLYGVMLRRVGVRTRGVVRDLVLPTVGSMALAGAVFVITTQVTSVVGVLALSGVAALAALGGLLYAARGDVRHLRATSAGLA